MRIYKTFIVAFVLLMSILLATTISAEKILTIPDDLNDVLDKDAETVSYPNLDIKEISVDREGNQIELSLELISGGKILESGFIVAYSIYLTTNKNMYEAMYSYSEADLEDLGLGGDGVIITAYPIDASLEDGVDVNVKSYSGIGTNELKIVFDLLSGNEKCISIDAISMYMSDLAGSSTYIDELVVDSSDFPSIDAGGTYYADAKEKVTFEGTIDEGNPDDYNWLWTIHDTSVTKEGSTAQHTFLIPGTYTGTLFVYDNQGRYAEEDFTVEVSGTSSNGDNNGDNNEPGFETIVMLAAIAIALIIIRKRR